MKVLFLTLGSEIVASSRVRVYQYLPYLEERGVKCKVISSGSDALTGVAIDKAGLLPRLSGAVLRLGYSGLKIAKCLFFAPFYNVVFIQKVLLPIPIQKLLRILNDNIVWDIDDAIYVSPPLQKKERYLLLQLISRLLKQMHKRRFTPQALLSKLIIVTNQYLREHVSALNHNVIITTGPIDTNRYTPGTKGKSDKIVVGWIGSPSTTFYLEGVEKVLMKLSEKYPNVVLELIGSSPLKIRNLRLAIKEWSLDSEVSNLQDFDIGIMPLTNDEWSRGKGGYKILQYMATGIPCVASPVGINMQLIQDGVNGFLARTEEEWISRLSLLIEDEALRKQMGARGREIALREYSFQHYAPVMIEALQRLL